MAYNYAPPPPAPAPAPPAGGGYPQYQPQYQHQAPRGGHAPRGGGRGGYHPGPGRPEYNGPVYGYTGQPPPPQPYGPQNPGQYPGQQPQPGGYPQPQWQDQGHAHHPQPPPPTQAPLSAQNYHPNYAQHMYQQPQPQPQPQPPYAPQPQPAYGPPQQPYGQPYPPPQQPNGPPAQQWGGPAPHPQNQSLQQPQFGGGRGRGGHHNDRGPPKAQVMGPPIRMGFDNGAPHDHPAPVSNGYPQQQPYGMPPPGPGPYLPAPYQGYPPPAAPPMSGPPPAYDGRFQQQNGRHHGRGGFHNNNNNNFRRPQFGDNKTRHHNNRKPGGPPSTPQNHHQKPDAASAGKKKKRKTNTLGLTPGDDSDEDDVDEEAKLSELIGADAPQPQDLAAWLAERRRNFPTQARIKAKLAAEAEQNGVKLKHEGSKDSLSSYEKDERKAEALRRELEKVESSLKRKREQQDAGDEMRDVVPNPSVSPSTVSDDEKPETLPTKPEANAYLPPPPKKADPTKHCKYYSTGGVCGKKGKCRFVHDAAVREAALKEREMNGGRMTLQQRLILNDKDQEDLTIVKTLQYLREKGLVKKEDKAASNGTAASSQPPSKNTQPKSQLPPPPVNGLPAQPPPSVLSNQPVQRYQGWNLSGFGNTGVKSEN